MRPWDRRHFSKSLLPWGFVARSVEYGTEYTLSLAPRPKPKSSFANCLLSHGLISNWYWLIDGWQALKYNTVLANPAAFQQYTGIKHTDDKVLMALSNLPYTGATVIVNGCSAGRMHGHVAML